MKQETSVVARNYRLQEWAVMVRECNSRPHGMTVKQWCLEHDVTPANYYYRLTQVRKACLETLPTESIQQHSYVFYIIIGETSGNHPMVVWSEDGGIRERRQSGDTVPFGETQYGVPVGLQEGMALLPDKRHGEGGVAVHRGKILQESGVGDIVVIQQTKPLFFMGFPESKLFEKLVL